MPLTRLPAWAYLVIGLVPIVTLLTLGSALPLPKPLLMPLAGICTLWAVALTVYHWKRLDEAARAAHRWAWYWGGSSGLALAMVTVGLSTTWPDLGAAFTSLATYFQGPKWTAEQGHLFFGVVFTAMMQGLGFLGAWLFWWIAKR